MFWPAQRISKAIYEVIKVQSMSQRVSFREYAQRAYSQRACLQCGTTKYTKRPRSRRSGVVLVYVALGMVVFMGVAAMSVDMGMLYKKRADAQTAADAAALAGAWYLAQGDSRGAQTGAIYYAAQNGYDNNDPNVTVTTTTPWNGNPNWYHVMVRKPQTLIFAGALGMRSSYVAASATAQFIINVQIPIDPQYYGLSNGPVTYSVFGPDGLHSNGDKYSVNTLNNGQPNPDYNGKGWDFTVVVPSNYTNLNGTSNVQVEIFDPDCHNANNVASDVDELRAPHSSAPGNPPQNDFTTTLYSLIWDKDGNPSNPDPSDHVTIGQKSFGDDAQYDHQWNTPPGFTFDSSQYTTGSFRVNVLSTSGSSENGFSLRAGPPHPVDSNGNSKMNEATWHNTMSGASGTPGAGTNGTTVAADGRLPVNFNINGTADIMLGDVPNTAAGGHFYVTKFDTDVGAQGVYYTCDSLPGQVFPGVLAGNDQTVTDTITLPPNYPGGVWHAHYTAGASDTSSWSLGYDKGTGHPGGIRLVQ